MSSELFDLSVLRTSETPILTYSAVDRTQRHETLHMVGEGAAVGVPVGILSSLQDELLTLEVVVLKTHPAVEGGEQRY